MQEGKDSERAEQLLPLVYAELRATAQRYLRSERAGHTLQATALVHEAFVKLVGPRELPWQNRAHFFAAAAEAMRRILVDAARRKGRDKHGGDWTRIDLDAAESAAPGPRHDLVALDIALTRLATVDPQGAQLVELRHFAGLSVAEAAKVLGISL
ncbi:MAG: ECF-type sigma factor, partial [Planctomycetota bacterium]